MDVNSHRADRLEEPVDAATALATAALAVSVVVGVFAVAAAPI